jgi:hypothetical protein
MADVSVRIPGTDDVEAEKAAMARAVAHQFNIVTDAPQAKSRLPSAGNMRLASTLAAESTLRVALTKG